MNGRTKRMEQLWVRMQAMYGSRWLLEYGHLLSGNDLAPMAEIWAKTLDDVSNDQIAVGLRTCMARESGHPPSLPEFLRLCGATARNPLPAYAEFVPSNQPVSEIYRDLPSARCARMAEQLAEESRQVLKGGPDSALPEDIRRQILHGYWMTKLGETLIGKSLATRWQGVTA
ncbi:MAG: hypothetical protein ABTR20_13420 [Candidatus Competibacter sp.]